MNSIGTSKPTVPDESHAPSSADLERWKADLRGFLSNACNELNRLIETMERELETTSSGSPSNEPVPNQPVEEEHEFARENRPSDSGNKMPWWKY